MTTYINPAAGFHAVALQARTDAAGAGIDDLSGADLRALIDSLTPGVLWPGDGYKLAPDSGMVLEVGSGAAYTDLAVLQGTDPGQGSYLLRLGDDVTAVTIPAADVSNPRIDEVYLVVQDHAYDSSNRVLGRIAHRQGTPAASPSAPGPDAAWTAYLLLAQVTVGAGVTSIGAGDITDSRVFSIPRLAAGGIVPTGAVLDFAGSVAPTGYLLCDGSAISRTTYARLFAAIGILWGPGDGSTTFNLPDLRRRFRLGSGSGVTLAQTGGTFDHVHTGPSHTHDPGTLAVPAHSTHTHARGTLAVPDHATHTHAPGTLAVPAHATHSHGVTTISTTTNGSHNHGGFTGGESAIRLITDDGTSQVIMADQHTHPITSSGSHSHTLTGTTDAGGPTTHGAITGATAADGPTVHGTITGATAADGPTSHDPLTGATAAGGTGNTGTANPPYAVFNALIRT